MSSQLPTIADQPQPPPLVITTRPAPRASLVQRSGFRNAESLLDIFDVHFTKYVTPIIVKVTWVLALGIAAVWLIALLVLCLYTWMPDLRSSEDTRPPAKRTAPLEDWIKEQQRQAERGRVEKADGWIEIRTAKTVGYLTVAVGVVLGILWVRVLLESMIVLFHIARSLSSIDDKTSGGHQPS